MSDPATFHIVTYAFARPGREPQGRPFKGAAPTLVTDEQEAETARRNLAAKLEEAQSHVKLDARGRRSRRRRQAARSWRPELDRYERVAPSSARTTCWKWVLKITLGDWVDERLYDTVKIGRRRRAR